MNTAASAQSTFFDLQGHRGARGLLPENTLPAYEKAMELGVSTLELDVGVSKDGVVVISHDRSLNPEITRDASGAYLSAPILVNSLTLAQLKTYDVGRIDPASKYAPRFPHQTPIDGTRMPTLAELFERVKALGHARIRFNIETKISPEKPGETVSPESFAAAVLHVVRSHGMSERVTIQSFDWRTLQWLNAQQAGVRTSCLSAQQPWTNNIRVPSPDAPRWTGTVRAERHGDVPEMVKAAGCDTWSPYFGDISAGLVQKARHLGLTVMPWTVNEPQDLEAVIAMNPHGLITDYPDRALAILKRLGRVVP